MILQGKAIYVRMAGALVYVGTWSTRASRELLLAIASNMLIN